MKDALESLKAAIGDRLLAEGPLTKEYAFAVIEEISTAYESMKSRAENAEEYAKGCASYAATDRLIKERDEARADFKLVVKRDLENVDVLTAECTRSQKLVEALKAQRNLKSLGDDSANLTLILEIARKALAEYESPALPTKSTPLEDAARALLEQYQKQLDQGNPDGFIHIRLDLKLLADLYDALPSNTIKSGDEG